MNPLERLNEHETRRFGVLVDAFEIYRDAVRDRIRKRRDSQAGHQAVVLPLTVSDQELVVRIPLQPLSWTPDQFNGAYVPQLVRSMGIRGTEQVVAVCTDDFGIVSKYHGERHRERALRGGVWLRAARVRELLDSHEEMRAAGIVPSNEYRECEAFIPDRDDNLLVDDEGALTWVDNGLSSSPRPEWYIGDVPSLVSNFSNGLRRFVAPQEQIEELREIVRLYGAKYPDSPYNYNLGQVLECAVAEEDQ